MLNSYILIKNYELCSQMGHLIGLLGVGKAQFSHRIETIMIPFRDHDETEYKKLVHHKNHNRKPCEKTTCIAISAIFAEKK